MRREKKLSSGGALTIPADLRRELGIESREKFKIGITPKGEILLSRIEGSCIVCSENKNLQRIDKVFVCENCYEKMKGVFEHDR